MFRVAPHRLLSALASATLVLASASAAQTGYAQVQCMLATSPDYEAVETEIWQPMHQEAVNRGLKTGWSFYVMAYGDLSDCDYYTVNQFAGEAQLNDQTSYADLFAAVHPGMSWDEAAARTVASRRIVRSELWTWVDGVPGQAFRYLQVNLMSAEDGDAYTAMESEVWKPVHEALLEDGHRAGWSVWQLSSPGGSSVGYNYATVDALAAIGPAPYAEAFTAVHPGRDATALMAQAETLRTLVRSEIWTLIATTQAP